MITDLKPYPAMKVSGVEWLGARRTMLGFRTRQTAVDCVRLSKGDVHSGSH
ncbi:MAG: hypothetical protein OXI33_06740 [Chloroflexota bacterium]|nr:hypothetical protein [Chloroflexota bacterium]